MRLVAEFADSDEATKLLVLLENAGVAAVMPGDSLSGQPISVTGQKTYRVAVVLDSQYEDALRLSQDRHHVVRHRLSRKEIRRIQKQIDTAPTSAVLFEFVKVFGIVLVAMAAILATAYLFGSSR